MPFFRSRSVRRHGLCPSFVGSPPGHACAPGLRSGIARDDYARRYRVVLAGSQARRYRRPGRRLAEGEMQPAGDAQQGRLHPPPGPDAVRSPGSRQELTADIADAPPRRARAPRLAGSRRTTPHAEIRRAGGGVRRRRARRRAEHWTARVAPGGLPLGEGLAAGAVREVRRRRATPSSTSGCWASTTASAGAIHRSAGTASRQSWRAGSRAASPRPAWRRTPSGRFARDEVPDLSRGASHPPDRAGLRAPRRPCAAAGRRLIRRTAAQGAAGSPAGRPRRQGRRPPAGR